MYNNNEYIHIAILTLLFTTYLLLQQQAVLPSLFLSLLIVYVHETGHKYFASIQYYTVEITQHTIRTIYTLLLTSLTLGNILILLPNTLEIEAQPRHRIGKKKKNTDPDNNAYIAIGGILASLFLLIPFTLIQAEVLTHATILLITHIIFSLLPLELFAILNVRISSTPQNQPIGDGLHILFASPKLYLTTLISTITIILIFLSGVLVLQITGAILLFITAISLNIYVKAL